jgi:chromosome segregation ATPase
MSGLDKPLRKLNSRHQDGKVMVPPFLIELITQLRENPLKAFEDMSAGHKDLNDLLEILKEAAVKEILKLKPAMRNKTITLSQDIMNGAIKELHADLLQHSKKRKDIEVKVEESGLKVQIMGLKDKKENLEKNKDIQRRRINSLKDNLEELNKEIAKLAANTQRNVRRLTKQDVKINIKD